MTRREVTAGPHLARSRPETSGRVMSMQQPESAHATKELCRQVSAPTRLDVEALRRLARYLRDPPRLVYDFEWLTAADLEVCYADTDFAG